MGVEATSAAPAAPATPPAAPAAADPNAGGAAPAAGAQPGGEGGDPAAQPAAGAAPAADPNAAPGTKKPPWFQTRIDQLTREKWEERRAREALEEENRQLRAKGGAPAAPAGGGEPAAAAAPAAPAVPTVPGVHADPNDPAVQQAAARIIAEQDFNKRCNEVYNAGLTDKDTPDFQAAVKNFDMLGGLGQHRQLVEAVTQLEGGHKILHHLGTHLEDAMRITAMPPIQMGMELIKLAGSLKAAPKVSAAAPPPATVNGGAPAAEPKPDANGEFKSQEEYRAWRKKQFKRH